MVLNEKIKVYTALELLKSIPNAKREWNAKTPFQKWCYIYNFGRVPCHLLRIPLYREDPTDVHWFGYFWTTYICTDIALTIYTIFYYMMHGNLLDSLPSTCISSIMVAYLPLLISIVAKPRFKISACLNFAGKYVYQDNHECTEYNRICSEQLGRTARNHTTKISAILLSFICCIINPAYVYFADGTKTTTTELHWPCFEPKSNAEFTANLSLQILIGVHAIQLYLLFEIFFSLFANFVSVAPQLTKLELTHTIQLCKNKSISKLELHKRFRNCVLQSNDTDDFLAELSRLFYWRNLFNLTAWTYMIAMSIFCQYMLGFAAGYGMACMQWVQWFYVCDDAQNIQDNGFAEALYDVEWDHLPLDIQKIIALLISRKQSNAGMKLGPFGTCINRTIFQITSNKIYTLVMFLMNFTE